MMTDYSGPSPEEGGESFDDDLEMLDGSDVVLAPEMCACGKFSTWVYDPATMAPHNTVTERTPYCAEHGPNTPPLVAGPDAAEPEPVTYVDMELHDDNVAVVPFAVRNKIGSVWLASEEKSPFHRVIAVGPGKPAEDAPDRAHRRKPMNARVGDKVLVAGYAGVDLKVDDVEYRIIRDCDIVARFPEPAVEDTDG